MIDIRIRFVDRVNDGNPSYWVKKGPFYLGRVVLIRPGAWMAEGCDREFTTRREAGQYLAECLEA